MPHLPPAARTGFTLIELSIVLVVIGLLVGGVLAGQDLIRVAELRATVSQLQRYDTAVNAFRLKYNCLPDDCREAAAYGLPTTVQGRTPNGLGTGLIDNGDKTMLLWVQLAAGGLVGEDLSLTPNSSTPATKLGWTSPNYGPVGVWVQDVSLVRGDGTRGRPHYFDLCAYVPGLDDSDGGNVPPADARALDAKLDDGLPLAGAVQASSALTPSPAIPPAVTPPTAGVAGSEACVVSGPSPQSYNVTTTYTTTTAYCNVTVRSTF